MATITGWNPFGVSLDLTATGSSVTRKSPTQFTVKINASWETYYSGAQTNYGMTASSGGGSVTLNKFGTKAGSGSGSFTGTYSISGNGSATKSISVTFKNYEENWKGEITQSATKTVSFNVTVPAWTSYTISYNANGGSGAPSSQTKWKDQTLTLSSTKPTRSGYTFVGWGVSTTDTGANYSAGGSYTANTSITLYAIWKKTITLSYNANGGSGAPSSQSATVYNSTTNYKFTLSSTKPTRTGYTFLGWSTSNTATSSSYSSGGTITLSASDILYAVWKINTYTISYNANGGSGAPSSQTKTYGTTLTLSSTKPTRSGYIFLGWSTSSTATSSSYGAGGSYTSNSSATLYAVWAQSTFIQTIMARYQQVDGNYTEYSQVYAATLNQGDICSWSSKETDEYYSASVSYTVGTSSLVKYVDIARKRYGILYDANGGLYAPKTQYFYYGCDLHLTNKRPTRSGYTFVGWSYTPNSTEINYRMNDIYDSTDTSNPTLYAVWSKNKSNIRFCNTGISESCEYVESDSVGFDTNGTIYANTFTENTLENISFSVGLEFIASEIHEI